MPNCGLSIDQSLTSTVIHPVIGTGPDLGFIVTKIDMLVSDLSVDDNQFATPMKIFFINTSATKIDMFVSDLSVDDPQFVIPMKISFINTFERETRYKNHRY